MKSLSLGHVDDIKMQVLWELEPYRPANSYQCFKGKQFLRNIRHCLAVETV